MKRVLIIGMSDTLGGVETYIYNLIKYIDQKKYYFDFLVIDEGNKSVFEKEITDLLGGDNRFYYCPNLKKSFNKSRKWLKNFYASKSYDVIYLNTCTAARVMYCLYGLKKDSHLITHSHNGRADGLNGMLNNKVFSFFVTVKSELKFACSDIAYRYMFIGKPKGNWFIPNGVETERFRFNAENRDKIRTKFSIPKWKKIIGSVGRFTEQKNQSYLIEIAEQLGENYVFILIGNGQLKDKLISIVHNHRLQKQFIVLPAQKDIEKYYSAMDVFVMPSLFEGLPITAVEAQCNGLPCILSESITKQVQLTENCIFLSLDDKKEWAIKIKEVVSHRYNGEMAIKKSGFDVQSTAGLISNAFDSL